MAWDVVTALATVAQAVIVGGAGIAALIQIRHLRRQNDFAAFTQLLNVLSSPDFNRARGFVTSELAERLRDAEYRREIVEGRLNSDRHPETLILNYFQQVGTLLVEGVVDAALLVPLHSGIAPMMWRYLLPVVALRRATFPLYMIGFEALVILCNTYEPAGYLKRYRALTGPGREAAWEASQRDVERAYGEFAVTAGPELQS